MFEIIPNTRHDIPAKEPVLKRLGDVLSGTRIKPFGFYDFIIVLTAAFWYFFFTGLAIARGKQIPPRWLVLGKKMGGGKVLKNMQEKIVREPTTPTNSIRVEPIIKPIPVADAAGNPLKK